VPAGVFMGWIIDLYAAASILNKQIINIDLAAENQ
jgi:hypothetical protein